MARQLAFQEGRDSKSSLPVFHFAGVPLNLKYILERPPLISSAIVTCFKTASFYSATCWRLIESIFHSFMYRSSFMSLANAQNHSVSKCFVLVCKIVNIQYMPTMQSAMCSVQQEHISSRRQSLDHGRHQTQRTYIYLETITIYNVYINIHLYVYIFRKLDSGVCLKCKLSSLQIISRTCVYDCIGFAYTS